MSLSTLNSYNLRTNKNTLAAPTIRMEAWRAMDQQQSQGAKLYCRERDLARLLPILPGDALAADAIILRLERALARERLLGQAGHWSYNLMRHMSLRHALDGEHKALSGHKKSATRQG